MARSRWQHVAVLLDEVGVLAVGLLAVHDVTVVVAHRASSLQEVLGVPRVVEPVPADFRERKRGGDLRCKGCRRARHRPGLATEALILSDSQGP
eukprot:UN4731